MWYRNEVLTNGAFWRDKVFSHNLVRTTYNRFMRKNSAFMGAVIVGAIFFEVFFGHQYSSTKKTN